MEPKRCASQRNRKFADGGGTSGRKSSNWSSRAKPDGRPGEEPGDVRLGWGPQVRREARLPRAARAPGQKEEERRPPDTNMGRIWGRMEALSQLGARLGEATQQPGREECATECVARFCRAAWPRILDEQAYPSWEDNGEYGDVFCNVPLVGSAKATLRLVLTRYDKFGAHMTILIVRTECTNAEAT